MNREIKFRVLVDCEDHGKRWIYPHKITIFDTVVYIYDPESDHEYQLEPEQLKQYTGLKDKNGKEIYEDDLVRKKYIFNSGSKNEQIVKIVFHPCDGYFLSIADKTVTYEIIGNIWENPELLK